MAVPITFITSKRNQFLPHEHVGYTISDALRNWDKRGSDDNIT
jgi:hypothetical protein